jgi:hypothetical protein
MANRTLWIKFLNINTFSLMDITKNDLDAILVTNRMGLHNDTWQPLCHIADILQTTPAALNTFETPESNGFVELYAFKDVDMAALATAFNVTAQDIGQRPRPATRNTTIPTNQSGDEGTPTHNDGDMDGMFMPGQEELWAGTNYHSENHGYRQCLPPSLQVDPRHLEQMSQTQLAGPTQTDDFDNEFYITDMNGQRIDLSVRSPNSNNAQSNGEASSSSGTTVSEALNPPTTTPGPSSQFQNRTLITLVSDSCGVGAAGGITTHHYVNDPANNTTSTSGVQPRAQADTPRTPFNTQVGHPYGSPPAQN